MTIKELKNRIQQLENEHGNVDNCTINFRIDYDSEVVGVNYIEEDLCNQLTNNTLESVVFLHDNN